MSDSKGEPQRPRMNLGDLQQGAKKLNAVDEPTTGHASKEGQATINKATQALGKCEKEQYTWGQRSWPCHLG